MEDTPIEQLRAVAARRHRLLRQLELTRVAERAAIFDVIESKAAKQADVARITEYTREHVRRLDDAEAEARGLPPRAVRENRSSTAGTPGSRSDTEG